MKILLTTLNAKYIHINLAIRLLYELNQDHVGLEMKEFTIKEDKGDIADYCQAFEVVAFSCYIWNITQTLDVCKRIKALNPRTKILLGGPEVSYDWQEVIALPHVDYIITGEGETPFREFLEQYPEVENIPNLVSHTEGGDIKYFQTSTMFDLTQYRHINPYKNDKPEELYNKVCYIETSRGCPYKCEFCLASLDNKVRYLPNETIKEHLLYLMQHGRVIKFLDRTFNIKRDFTIDIFTFILEHHRPENVFQFEITADILHADIIQFINEKVPKGLFRFEIGIQTVNQKANLEVSRKQNFDKTKGIIVALQDKVEMHLDLIVGLALDYWEDIKYSFEEVFKLFAPELQLGFLKFLKGTQMRVKTEQHGFIYDPNPPYQIIESNYLSRAELFQIEVLENALEIYWNKKRSLHTLKYVTNHYSIFDFLSGLGTFFSEKKDFHKYNLTDVFEILADYSAKTYPDDIVLKELIGIDYYLFHKVKPKSLFLEEVEKSEKYKLIDMMNLNPHKFRYLVFPISFNFDVFVEDLRVEKKDTHLIVQYTGTEKAETVKLKNFHHEPIMAL
jgi:anaerobic magnesium-protoporphyrin IX monomethyl ester cyclase